MEVNDLQMKTSFWGGLERLTLIQNDMGRMKAFEDIFVNNPDENKVKEAKPVEKEKTPKRVGVVRSLDG